MVADAGAATGSPDGAACADDISKRADRIVF